MTIQNNEDDIMLEVVLSVPEIRRLLTITHQDLARVEGNIVIARRKLVKKRDNGAPYLSGSAKERAEQVVKTAPGQARVLEGAIEGLQEALADARRDEKIK